MHESSSHTHPTQHVHWLSGDHQSIKSGLLSSQSPLSLITLPQSLTLFLPLSHTPTQTIFLFPSVTCILSFLLLSSFLSPSLPLYRTLFVVFITYSICQRKMPYKNKQTVWQATLQVYHKVQSLFAFKLGQIRMASYSRCKCRVYAHCIWYIIMAL